MQNVYDAYSTRLINVFVFIVLQVYSLLTPEQEEKDINARSRYNGRLFLSWLQDVDDKWDKIKVCCAIFN